MLWAVPHLSWWPGVASGVGEIDLTAQLVACPNDELLWGDRIIREVTLYYRDGLEPQDTVGSDPVDVDRESAEQTIDAMAAELLTSMR